MTRILRSPDRFSETVHKAGQTDMFAVMRTYQEIGFDGPLRPDHLPTMEGEGDLAAGYNVLGHLFAIGYIKKWLAEGAARTAG
jgi:mannonate dehydratase